MFVNKKETLIDCNPVNLNQFDDNRIKAQKDIRQSCLIANEVLPGINSSWKQGENNINRDLSEGTYKNLTKSSRSLNNNFDFKSKDSNSNESVSGKKRLTYENREDSLPEQIKKIENSQLAKVAVIEKCIIKKITACGTEEGPVTKNGIQTVHFEDGSRFIGHVNDGKPSGFGVLNQNGTITTGDFEMDEENNLVQITAKSRKPQYVSTEKADVSDIPMLSPLKKEAEGIFLDRCSEDDIIEEHYNVRYNNGDFYQGPMENHLPHGKGMLNREGQLFEGEWINGVFQNNRDIEVLTKDWNRIIPLTSVKYASGDKYVGQLDQSDFPHGRGALKRGNGEYMGIWNSGHLVRLDQMFFS